MIAIDKKIFNKIMQHKNVRIMHILNLPELLQGSVNGGMDDSSNSIHGKNKISSEHETLCSIKENDCDPHSSSSNSLLSAIK